MKKLIILSLMSSVCYTASAQFVYKIKADSVKITNDSCGTDELIIENSTKNIKGFLYNYGNGRTRFQPGLIKLNDSLYIIGADTLKLPAGVFGNTIYTGDGTISGTRNVNFSSVGGGISFNMKTATDPSFTRYKNSYFMTNPDWGGRVFATYQGSDDDSATTAFSVVNDGGGINRGNEIGYLIMGSKSTYNFGGQQGGGFIRADRLPMTFIADINGNPSAAYPIQFYTGTHFFQDNTNSIPTLRLNGDQTIDAKSKMRIGSSTDQGSYKLQVTGDTWTNGKFYAKNNGSFGQNIRIGWLDDGFTGTTGSIYINGPGQLMATPFVRIDSFTYGGNFGAIDISSNSGYNYGTNGGGAALRFVKTAANGLGLWNFGAVYVDHSVNNNTNQELLYTNYAKTRVGASPGYSYYADASALPGGTGRAYAFYADSGYSYFRERVGINTTTPQAKLDVNGDVRISSLPFLSNRDTVLTYDPSTKQLMATKLTGGGAGPTIYTGDGTLTGNRMIKGAGGQYGLVLDSMNIFDVYSVWNMGGTIWGSEMRTTFDLGSMMAGFVGYPTHQHVGTVSAEGVFGAVLGHSNNQDSISTINVNIDSIAINSYTGKVTFPNLQAGAASDSVLTWDAQTKKMRYRNVSSFGGGGGFSTANNGLSYSSGNVQLGDATVGNSPLLHNTYINTGTDLFLEVNGAKSSTTVGLFRVTNTHSSGTAARIDGGGRGLIVNSTNSNAIEANAGAGTALYGSVTSGLGVWGNSGTNGVPLVGTAAPSSSNTTVVGLQLNRDVSTGSTANYSGVSIDFRGKLSDGTGGVKSNQLISRFKTNGISSTSESEFLITSYNHSSTLDTSLRIAYNGKLRLDKYGAGAFTGTATATLQVDASGNIIEGSPGGGGTPGGSNGQVQFNNSGSFAGSSNLFWDNTNNRLGIGTSSPQTNLHVNGTTRFDLGSDATGDIFYRNSSGQLTRLPIGASNQILAVNSGTPAWANTNRLLGKITSPTSAIANTETQVVGVTIPANTLAVGDVIRVTAYGVQTQTSAASTSVYRIRIGSTTLTGNVPASSSWVNGNNNAKTNTIIKVSADVLITAIGSGGTAIGQVSVDKGFASATTPTGVTSSVTVNTTVSNIAEFTFISGASTTTNTFHTATIEIIKN